MSYRDKKYETILVSVKDSIAVVQFNRPEALNATNDKLNYERLEIYTEIGRDPEVRAVIITGGNKVFSAGGDLVTLSQFNVADARQMQDISNAAQKALADMPKPTIASIAGFALGGGMETVLLCDLRIAAENAEFALPEINAGVFPASGGTQRLVQNTSICKAKEMIFFGTRIDAHTALELGLINKVVPLADLEEATFDWANRLVKKAPMALKMAKAAINAAWSCDNETGIRVESDAWCMLYGTNDQKEGMKAFIEKRKPVFMGN